MSYERNLVIVHTPGLQALSDFTTVRALIAERAPEIEVTILTNGHGYSYTRRRLEERPTLVFAPRPLVMFRPSRGRIYQSIRYTKMEEYHRLDGAGLPVPEAVMVRPDLAIPDGWGPYTVLKPNSDTLQGRGVRLVRTADVRWIDPLSWPRDDPRHGREMVAQRFVDTGLFAESHRVMTVFGRPIYSLTSRSLVERPPLDPGRATDIPIASNAGGSEGRTLFLNFDESIINLGRRTAAAFPEIPVLGVDVIREAATGRLFILEVNAGVATWHISSNYFEPYRRKFGLDLHSQFGALDTIADALIDVTRREAV